MYHINPKTGNPGVCRAKRSCPFGDLETEHYDSKEAAAAAYEKAMSGSQLTSSKREGEPSDVVYEFPRSLLASAEARIEKANKKAEKAGIPERFTYETEIFEVRTKDPNTGLDKISERVRLKLNRPTLQHDGWTFAGTMSWDAEAGLVTRMAPGQTLVEKPKEKFCDVCGQERTRNDTYIVQKNGEQKQVGSNCLKRFMGIRPAGLWMLDFELDVEEGDDEMGGYRGARAEERVDVKQILAVGLAIAEEKGWVPRSAAWGERRPTADYVDDVVFGNPRTAPERRFQKKILARAKELEKNVSEVLAQARAIEGDSDYADNLRAVANSETVSARNVPLLISAIGHAERNKAKKIAKEAAAVSTWVGKVGDKLPERKVTVENVKRMSGSYGYRETSSLLVTMRDEEGNLYKTFYSGAKVIKKGESYNITGTVKKHQEWNGAKENMLNRVKFNDMRPDKLVPTKLESSSPLAKAHTADEADKIANAEHRRITREFKKKAGPDGWTSWGTPKDRELAMEFDKANREISDAYSIRWRELDEAKRASEVE